MPRHAPFTRLCQTLAQVRSDRADLHTHSTASDGVHAPATVVRLAREARLAAVALTDHDTVAGLAAAQAAAPDSLEVIAGVEITAEFAGRELHLLGYFFDPTHPALTSALLGLRQRRHERFWAITAYLEQTGFRFERPAFQMEMDAVSAPGRRHLAEYLVRTRQAPTVQHVFHQHLGDRKTAAWPKARLPLADAIQVVRVAGGVTSWAHPPPDVDATTLGAVRELGLHAVEVEYPGRKATQKDALRRLAATVGLGISGGSDSHGSQPRGRSVGACGITRKELAALRQLAN